MNERTNATGQVQRPVASKEASSTVDARGTLAQVRLVKAQLHDDQEPWFKGDVETMLIAKARGLWWYDEITYLDDSKDLLILNTVLGTTARGVYFYWFEKDGSNHDVSVSVKGVSLGVKIDDSDDLIGGTFMRHSLFVGDSGNGVAGIAATWLGRRLSVSPQACGSASPQAWVDRRLRELRGRRRCMPRPS